VDGLSSRQRPPAAVRRERLIESHLPLVKAVARRYAGRGADLDDLVQVGAMGLIKAADRFDGSRGVAFATFAEPTIEGEIRHHLRDRSAPVRIPRELQKLGKRLRSRQGELEAQLGRAPTLSELADAVEADKQDVQRALAAEQAKESVVLGPGESHAEAGDAEPFADNVDRLLLAERMNALGDRERRIVYLRFHADLTERQIARELGISQAHVSRLLAAALGKLRLALGDEKSPAHVGDTTAPGGVSRPGAASPTADAAHAGGPDRPPPRAGNAEKPTSGYSGRFLVRMSSDLHQQLAQAAEREQLSLNRFVTGVLAEAVAAADSGRPDAEPGAVARQPDAPRADAPRTGAPEPPSANPTRTLRVALAVNLVVVVVAVTVAVVLLVLALQRGI
jgi:RNA polymerase sigma-B factor